MFFFGASFLYGQSRGQLDSLKLLLKNANNDTTTVSLLIQAAKHFSHSNPDSTIEYAQKALELSNRLNYPFGKGKAYRFIGIANSAKSEYDNALKYLYLSLQEFIKSQSLKEIGVLYTSIGNVYKRKSEYDKALEYYLKSLDIIKLENNQKKIASAYNNIGIIYLDLKMYDKALDYFKESLKKNTEVNFTEGQSFNYGNIGVVFKEKKQYDSAIYNLKQALVIFQELNFKNEIAHVYSSLGDIYTLQKKYDSAFNYIQLANKIYTETSDKSGIAETFNILADIYLNKKMYSSAEKALNISLGILKSTGFKKHEIQAYFIYSKLDSAGGDYKNAFLYRNKYNNLKDSIFSIEKNNAISLIQGKYNVSEKEKENIILKKNIQINNVKIRKQKIINIIAVLSLLLSLGVIFLIIYSLRKIRRKSVLLHNKNEEINTQNIALKEYKDKIDLQYKEISRQHEELELYKNKLELIVEDRTKELHKALIQAKESDSLKTQFLENLQHEIRTPMNAIYGFSTIYDKNNLKINHNYFYEIQKSMDDLLHTIDKLVIFSKFQIEDYQINKEEIILKDYFEKVKHLILSRKEFLKKDDIEIEFFIEYTQLPEYVISDEFVFNCILEELIDNAFKFTEKGKISITANHENNALILKVSDTGIGIKEEISDKIFEFMRKFDHENILYRGMGVGLAMVRKAVDLLKGKITIKSDKNNGAELTIIVPDKI